MPPEGIPPLLPSAPNRFRQAKRLYRTSAKWRLAKRRLVPRVASASALEVHAGRGLRRRPNREYGKRVSGEGGLKGFFLQNDTGGARRHASHARSFIFHALLERENAPSACSIRIWPPRNCGDAFSGDGQFTFTARCFELYLFVYFFTEKM